MPVAKTKTAAKAPAADPDVRPSHKLDADKVCKGDLMAIVTYITVKSKGTGRSGNIALTVDDLHDSKMKGITIEGKELIENCLSADQFSETIKATKTKLAEILSTSYNRPFTCKFVKQPEKPGEIGEERTLRGKLIETEPLMGRSKVEDLDVRENYRFRLIDHRTILELVVDGVKWVLK